MPDGKIRGEEQTGREQQFVIGARHSCRAAIFEQEPNAKRGQRQQQTIEGGGDGPKLAEPDKDRRETDGAGAGEQGQQRASVIIQRNGHVTDIFGMRRFEHPCDRVTADAGEYRESNSALSPAITWNALSYKCAESH
jgi:hypothetical protein